MKGLRIGVLAMADNPASVALIRELGLLGVTVHALFLARPGTRSNLKRITRKLRAAGIYSTFRRAVFAMDRRLSMNSSPPQAEAASLVRTIHVVTGFGTPETQRLIRGENLDLLLSYTDEILRRATFSIPRLGTLNAHPGWNPEYRGLGAVHRMLRDGYLPAVTVHFIDEGIDTGPILFRDVIENPVFERGEVSEVCLATAQARGFAKALEILSQGPVRSVDTFLEPSRMSRGLNFAEVADIRANVVRNLLVLRRIDQRT
ncbi:formyltransferase family protein [Methylobacterium nigriterrae]|uniref:formyltransferase family protein n=1 Tax=Methylobacterium nigriterrae TaxID=3127512 RepID=UPI003013EB2C